MEKNETRSLSFFLHKTHLKWIKDLNIRYETEAARCTKSYGMHFKILA